MNNERLAIEDKLLEVQLQHEGLHDLVATLKDGKGAQKVTEWHGKMEALRLDELRHQREIARLQQQAGHVTVCGGWVVWGGAGDYKSDWQLMAATNR